MKGRRSGPPGCLRAALLMLLTWLTWHAPGVHAQPARPGQSRGQLPTSYVTASAAFSWTGRLRAIAFRPTLADGSLSLPPDAWEAGAVLDRRSPQSRRIFTSLAMGEEKPERLVPLDWTALDEAARHDFDASPDTGESDGGGRQRLDWLRGQTAKPAQHAATGDGGIDPRPRDTRLGNANGARVLVVPPPLWRPGQPEHTPFRLRYWNRPTTVWLGTADGLLHGFDAITGEEVVAYFPRTLHKEAPAIATAGHRVPPSPCPRPEAVDAKVSGEWRTLMLCGVSERERKAKPAAAGLFALDITDPNATVPIGLVWEAAASADLPLAPKGPVRAASLSVDGARRWYAVSAVAPAGTLPTVASGSPPIPPRAGSTGLVLLSLDKPAHGGWLDRHAILRLDLPAGGCDGKRDDQGSESGPEPLLAVTVLSDDFGAAIAAYAIDARGRLWRFALHGPVPWPLDPERVRCLHAAARQMRLESVEPPLVVSAGLDRQLVIYGAGSEVAAIFDAVNMPPGARPIPQQVRATLIDDGVRLDASGNDDSSSPRAGWRIELPRPGEVFEEVLPAGHGYVALTTRTPDDRLHGYLIEARSGRSVVRERNGAPPAVAPTGFTLGQSGSTSVMVSAIPIEPPAPAEPGTTVSAAHDLSIWAIQDGTARRTSRTLATARSGRLSWRELMAPPSP